MTLIVTFPPNPTLTTQALTRPRSRNTTHLRPYAYPGPTIMGET